MNDKNICSAVRDLLPLYSDGVLSNDTETFIREHLETCTACQQVYISQSEQKQQDNGLEFQETKERQHYKRIAVKIKRRRIALLCGAVALLLLVFFMSASMFQYAVVSGRCMEPTVLDSEKYVVNKWSYVIQRPKRNDIIVYERNGIYYLTRIVGLPGELTEMQDGILYVNSNPMNTNIDTDTVSDVETVSDAATNFKTDEKSDIESNIKSDFETDVRTDIAPAITYPRNYILAEKKLAEDEYMVIPDNLSEGGDSVHYIQGSEITGKVIITH
ncbi:signal peptidase I [Blautia schinkii]|nr:signal peptidase I [Blautia schinkii]